MSLVDKLDSLFYPGVGPHWDDEILRSKILGVAGCSSVVLDYGAGRGALVEMRFSGKFKFLAGVDVDNAVLENSYLDEGGLLDPETGRIPYPDATFDLVFSDNVFEHLSKPHQVLAEISRVLKPGGKLIVKTPNKNHYVALISRVTPLVFHKWFNRIRGRPGHDTFPTHYRCNTEKKVRELARMCGYAINEIGYYESRPEYLRFSSVTYLFGIIYERFVNRFQFLKSMRCVLVFSISKD